MLSTTENNFNLYFQVKVSLFQNSIPDCLPCMSCITLFVWAVLQICCAVLQRGLRAPEQKKPMNPTGTGLRGEPHVWGNLSPGLKGTRRL